MWLPTPVYERVPQFWLLLGLLFMSSGTYLGFDYSLSFVYFAVGFVCVTWSITVFVKRARHRTNPTRKPIVTFTEEDPQNPVQTAQEIEAPVGHAS
jgi:hypothetical protein